MLETSLHFPIKPGVVAAWNARTVVIISLHDHSFTRVRDVATGEQCDAPVEELQGPPAIGRIDVALRTTNTDGDSFGIRRELSGSRRDVVSEYCDDALQATTIHSTGSRLFASH